MTSLRKIVGTREYNLIWCNIELCGIVSFEIGQCILFLAFYFIFMRIIPNAIVGMTLKIICYILLFFIYSMAVVSHFRCCFTDPGSVPHNVTYLPDSSDDDQLLFCAKCDSFKPPRAHHCSTCNRCIVRMDHHCPWTNNCIGYRNMKYFILFLVYTFFMCIFTLCMDVCHLYYIYHHFDDVDKKLVVLTMMTISLACMFMGFTGSMLTDAVESLQTNTTGIDRLKGNDYKETDINSFRLYFGEKNKWSFRWLFPLSPRQYNLEIIRGYRYILTDLYSV